jgi:hypothetical protein
MSFDDFLKGAHVATAHQTHQPHVLVVAGFARRFLVIGHYQR